MCRSQLAAEDSDDRNHRRISAARIGLRDATATAVSTTMLLTTVWL